MTAAAGSKATFGSSSEIAALTTGAAAAFPIKRILDR